MTLLTASFLIGLGGTAVCAATTRPSPQAGDQVYLKASNAERHDKFGLSVAVSGDTIVVGAYDEESSATGIDGDQSSNLAEDSGAAYVYVRSGSTWTQQAYLKASNTGRDDAFGLSVAISGNTIVVGARHESSASTGVNGDQLGDGEDSSGAVYVFERAGTTWSQQAYIKASNAEASDQFGTSVDIDGDTIVVGANGEDSSSTEVNGNQLDNSVSSGAAYVFVREAGMWRQEAYLKASNGDALDNFGYSVAVSGDTIVVGAYGEESDATGINPDGADNSAYLAGAAYVFSRTGSAWAQEAYLKASNTEAHDRFGWLVDVSDETVIVAAPFESGALKGINTDDTNNDCDNAGAVYVFVRSEGSWIQEAYLKSSNVNEGGGDRFGSSVSISHNRLLVGANGENSGGVGINGSQENSGETSSGAAYLFERTADVWLQQAYLKATNTDHGDALGESAGVSGNHLVVGARGEDGSGVGVNPPSNDLAPAAGAAYGYWIPDRISYTSFCNGDGGDGFGCTTCPCDNNAPLGTTGGCLNSTGSSARLIASGAAEASLPFGSIFDLRFAFSGAPRSSLVILLSGDATAPRSIGNPCFGLDSGLRSLSLDGLRCVVGNLKRLGARRADELGRVCSSSGATRVWGGESSPHVGLGARAGLAAGQTGYFQGIFRDELSAVCMNGLNTSQAIKVTFAQ